MPVIFKYGNELYVHDVVYDNGDKRVTQALVADKVIEHGVGALQVEATKMTEDYAEGVDEILRKRKKRINLTTKVAQRTTGGKTQRIFDKAPDIRERMVFWMTGSGASRISFSCRTCTASRSSAKTRTTTRRTACAWRCVWTRKRLIGQE